MTSWPIVLSASVLLILLPAAAGGCKSGEESASAETAVPSDFQIIFGQQGTFAGRGMGYTIDAEGVVVKWEGKYPGEVKEAVAGINADQVRRLWKHAEEIGFLSMQDQAMATAHSFVSVTAEGESRRVTWVDRDVDDPTPAQVFFDECMKTAQAAFAEPY